MEEGHATDSRTLSRRTLLQGAAAASAISVLPSGLVRAQGATPPPSGRVHVAIIGTGGQGIVNMKQLFVESDVRIAALCDINKDSDYSAFYYGGTAGLDPALALVKEQYGEACPTYRNYDEMLDKEDIDAVLIATPDHSHAIVAKACIDKGKHVYVEKPLCRSVEETRFIADAARKAGVKSQMGNFGHSGESLRYTCEWIWDGAIGDVYEVHAWCNTGADRWSSFKARPTETPPVPAGFDWKRWLEPVPERPYHPDYAPVRWRAWWQFGSGTIGDFACHHLDPAFMALKLGEADTFQVEATSVGLTEETCPSGSIIHFYIPARAGMVPVRISWYEGGLMPARPPELEEGRELGDHGILFRGTKGAILGYGWARDARIIPEAKMRAYKLPPKTLERVPGHHRDWLNACKGVVEQASTNFDYAGPLTEFCLMGNVALRSGKRIAFDWKNMQASNAPEAQKFINKDYRQGWTL